MPITRIVSEKAESDLIQSAVEVIKKEIKKKQRILLRNLVGTEGKEVNNKFKNLPEISFK